MSSSPELAWGISGPDACQEPREWLESAGPVFAVLQCIHVNPINEMGSLEASYLREEAVKLLAAALPQDSFRGFLAAQLRMLLAHAWAVQGLLRCTQRRLLAPAKFGDDGGGHAAVLSRLPDCICFSMQGAVGRDHGDCRVDRCKGNQ